MPISRLQKILRRSQQLLPRALPCSCALCGGRNREVVCAACQQAYFPVQENRCRRCALPLPLLLLGSQAECGACLQNQPAFDATIAVANYAAPIDQLVLALKFGAQLGLAQWMADRLLDALLAAKQAQQPAQLPDLLCAVPLGERRLRERGYNQALEIARPFSRLAGLPLDAKLCLRLRETDAQSLLPLQQRAKNMRHAFSVAAHGIVKIQGLHIGVVDDVMTTGRTLDEMARSLKQLGAAQVTNFVFARTELS